MSTGEELPIERAIEPWRPGEPRYVVRRGASAYLHGAVHVDLIVWDRWRMVALAYCSSEADATHITLTLNEAGEYPAMWPPLDND